MPSPRRRPPLALGDFCDSGFPRAKRKPAAVIPARPAELIRLMVYGSADASVPPMTLNEAAKHMRIQKRTAAHYFRHPAARAEYLRLVKDLREAEQIRNLHAAVEIRDDAAMRASAAGNRARIEAARFIEHRDDEHRGGVHVNIGVAVQNMPGYQVRSTSDPALIARVLAQAGSADTIRGDVIDQVRTAPAPDLSADDRESRHSTPRFHLDPRKLVSRHSDPGADLADGTAINTGRMPRAL